MMLARILPHLVAKEVRALLPLWLGALAALVSVSALGRRIGAGHGNIQALGLLVFGGASVTLGALSIGHEYSHRTLPLLLSQPASRARVFLVKQFVLAMMLLTLAVVAWTTVLFPSGAMWMTAVLVVLGGLFVTPWLTMLSRNPLAGAVFTGPVSGVIWLLVDVSVARPLKLVVFLWATLGVCAVAAVFGWRAFMRLEAIDGQGANLFFRVKAAGATGNGARTRNPVWLLIKKELGLQQLSLALAAFYGAGWLVLTVARLFEPRAGSEFTADVFGGLTVLYSGMLALLIGALGSAEERQLGTLEWQGLLPMASWKQWTAKVVTVLALSMLLSVALPALLLFTWGGSLRINQWHAMSDAGV